MNTETSPSCLLVPIGVDAMVVNAHVRGSEAFSRFTMNWGLLYNMMLSPVVVGTTSFASDGSQDGVYLHWALPGGLAQGIAPDPKDDPGVTSTQVQFRFAPNRWVVARFGPVPASGTTPAPLAVTAWVIQSDYLNDSAGSNAFVDPQPSTPGAYVPKTIGTSQTIQAWKGGQTSDLSSMYLTAVGVGDVTFAAYQPGVNNVFSFVDTTVDNHGLQNDTYSYLVAGWYSDPTVTNGDPLNATDPIAQVLDVLQWSVNPAPGTDSAPPLPTFVVCHGLATGVQWTQDPQGTTPRQLPVTSLPAASGLQVVVANTSLDALSTLLEKSAGSAGAEYVQHLEALMFNMLPSLDQPGGAAQLADKERQSWFGSSPGGTSWVVVAAPTGPGVPASKNPPVLTPAQQQNLVTLNTSQAAYDAASRTLKSMQWDLYSLWWKSRKTRTLPGPPTNPQDYVGSTDWTTLCDDLAGAVVPSGDPASPSFYDRVAAQLASVNKLAAGLPDPNDSTSIASYGASTLGLDATMQLKPTALDPFYQPAGPVVLTSGLPPGSKFVQADATSEDGTLTCRYLEQTITGIVQQGTSIPASAFAGAIPTVSNPFFPSGVGAALSALCTEAFFLDPANAALIAQQGPSGTTASEIAASIEARQNLVGAVPPAFSAPAAWAQPFTPLFLEWAIEYAPTPLAQMNQWQFDGTDYVWNPATTVDTRTTTTYTGRTLLTPHAADLFRQRVEDYLTQMAGNPDIDTDLEAVEALLEQLDTWDMMSQALSGFHDLLIMRDPTFTVAPDSTVSSLVQDQFHAAPAVSLGNVDTRAPTSPSDPPAARFFFPIRAGFFRFTQLQAVDCFGQVLNLLAGNDNQAVNPVGDPDSFFPILDGALAPPSGTSFTLVGNAQSANWGCLPPRVVQASRLDVSLVPVVPSADPTTNPVHGWLVPNHLDGGISVYDAAGAALGELLSVAVTLTGGPTGVLWSPAPPPRGGTTPQSPSQIQDPVLQSVVVNLQNEPAAFSDFLQVIDETMWSVDPLGQRTDPNLSILIGRPLAVVEVKLTFELLNNEPAENQSWSTTSPNGTDNAIDTSNLLTQSFQIRLGDLARADDGLVGYFNGDYSGFNSVVTPSDWAPGGGQYITPIGASVAGGSNYLALDFGTTSSITVPALVDPRGSVHATTGMLPTVDTALADEYVVGPMAAMAVTFRSGPLLTDPSTIRLPSPAETNGTWTWLQLPTPVTPAPVTPPPYDQRTIVAADDVARLGGASALVDGWLRFTPQSS